MFVNIMDDFINLIEDALEKSGPPPSPRTFAANTKVSLPQNIPDVLEYLEVKVYTTVSSPTVENFYGLLLNHDICDDEAWEDALILAVPGVDERLFWSRAHDDAHFFYVFPYLFAHLGVQLPFSRFICDVLTVA